MPSTSAQELTEDTAFQVILAFLQANELVFQGCYHGMSQCFKRLAFEYMEISDCKNLGDPVLLAQFLGDCLWSYSPYRIQGLASLLSLLKTRNNLTYEILRMLWYLCNSTVSEEAKRTGCIERVQERSLPSDPTEEMAVYQGGYQFACHFLASAILGKKSDFGAGFIQELLRIYLRFHFPDAVTAILVYWSKFPQEFMPMSFTPAAVMEMSHEQFQLYLEIAAFYPSTGSPIEEICSRFEAVGMAIPLKLASYLEERTRIIAFVTYFRKGPLLHKALFFVLQAMKSMSQKEDTFFDTLNAVLTVLDLENLPQDVVLSCTERLKELFDLQFAYSQVNLPFSEIYLKYTSLVNQNSTEIAEKIRELLFFATVETADQGKRLGRLVDYLEIILQDCSSVNLHVLTDKTTDLMVRCTELFPHLVDPLFKSAISAEETLHQKQASVTGEDLTAIGDTIISLDKFITILNHQSSPETYAPLELMTMIEDYTMCILPEDRDMPDRITLKTIAKECRKHINGLNHLALSQTDYNDDSKFTTIVWCLMSRHAKKMSKGIPQRWQDSVFRQKWQNHAFLVQKFSRFALFQLLFRPEQDLMLRRTILAIFISNFQKKKELDHDKNIKGRLFNDKLTIIRLALSSSFQLPSTSGHLNMIETVLNAECLKAALVAMKVATNRYLYASYKNKIYFADLGPDTFGLTIFGGYILLNKDYLERGKTGKCVLMITLCHELAHAERRFSKDGTVNLEENSPLRQGLDSGIPGKPILTETPEREGGNALESLLFGVRVTFVARAQVDFVTTGENWKMNLNEFRRALEHLGNLARPGDIAALARQNSQFYCFEARRSCHARG